MSPRDDRGSARGETPPDVVAVGDASGLQYVRMTPAMAAALEQLELAAFPTAVAADLYDEHAFRTLAQDFPEGSVVGFDGPTRDAPVALGLGVRACFDFDSPHHVMKDLLAAAPTESGDDPSGDWYYGTDIVVSPDHRRRGIGGELYELRKQICVDLDLRGIVAGGVIPGFVDHKSTMTADEYIEAVAAGDLYDPTLTFQIANGFEALGALPGYLRDPAVDDWASLIVWRRPDRVHSTATSQPAD